MNIKEYISSGVLESYVLGSLTEQEKTEVERDIQRFSELKEELIKVEETQKLLLLKAAIKPRESVKEGLFAKIGTSSEQKTVKIDRSDSLSGFWRFAVAASITIALIASYLAYNYRSKWKSTKNDLIALQGQNLRVAEDYNQVNQNLDKLKNEVEVLTDPEFVRVVMKGTPKSPESLAAVYWNESSREVYLRIERMKELSSENQYQLWAIIDGKPVDAGVFDASTAGLLKMKEISKGAKLFAVTIEPRGGKQSPTLETMQVAGEVKKG